MPFQEILDVVLRHEGGEVNDPRDPGGHTRYGISQRAYPDIDIGSLTIERARGIYLRDYWKPIRGAELPKHLQLAVFDGAVNHGPRTSIRLLQRSVGATVDGWIGPETIGRANQADPIEALDHYCAARAVLYGNLDTFDRFGLGWMRRLMDIHRLAVQALPKR